MVEGKDAAMQADAAGGKLVVVPTPLGNLGDMTRRALKALEAADTVCAEDTRVTGKLLAAFGLHKRLERLDEALVGQRSAAIVERVQGGEVIAYCSDAGMPGVSDPGMRLVRACRQAGAAVEVLPGGTAAATAYVASGSDNQRFFFGGFFPRKAGERRSTVEALRELDAALIFYESPNRLVGALEFLADAFPLREAAVCRELTKLHEEVLRAPLPQLFEEFARREANGGVKGEIVIVIDGPSKEEGEARAQKAAGEAHMRAGELASQGMRAKQIARILADELGISRNDAYEGGLGGGAAMNRGSAPRRSSGGRQSAQTGRFAGSGRSARKGATAKRRPIPRR